MAILFFPLILILGYFLLVRPQQQQARKQRSLLGNLRLGSEVQTAGGIIGRVVDLDDEFVQLQVGPGTTITFVRTAVARLLNAGADTADDRFSAEDLDEGGTGASPAPDEGDAAGAAFGADVPAVATDPTDARADEGTEADAGTVGTGAPDPGPGLPGDPAPPAMIPGPGPGLPGDPGPPATIPPPPPWSKPGPEDETAPEGEAGAGRGPEGPGSPHDAS